MVTRPVSPAQPYHAEHVACEEEKELYGTDQPDIHRTDIADEELEALTGYRVSEDEDTREERPMVQEHLQRGELRQARMHALHDAQQEERLQRQEAEAYDVEEHAFISACATADVAEDDTHTQALQLGT